MLTARDLADEGFGYVGDGFDDPQAAAELELAQRAFDERRPLWDERRLTIALPVVLGDVVYAVVAITSAPPLYRHDMIEKMAMRVAEQLARVAERERARAELAAARTPRWRRPGRSRSSWPP